MKNIYIFSGLGADERVFQRLDFSDYSTTFIKWIEPNKKETIEKYANRLLDQIKANNPILIGLSFGGLMAIEVSKLIDTDKLILISSAKSKNEIPFYYRFAGTLGLHKLLPLKLLKKSNFIINWLFGTTSTFEKELLSTVLKETDTVFLKWAIDKVVSWNNEKIPKKVFHIHGKSDKILPSRFIDSDFKINNGGHFMILNKAKEITTILKNYL